MTLLVLSYTKCKVKYIDNKSTDLCVLCLSDNINDQSTVIFVLSAQLKAACIGIYLNGVCWLCMYAIQLYLFVYF